MQPTVAHDDGTEIDFREGCRIAELWNRPQDPSTSIARARVAAGGTTRWHALANTTERYVILGGQGRVELGPPESRTCSTVGPGDVVFIPPGTPQRITAGQDAELVFLAICSPRFVPACYLELDADGRASGL